MKGKTTRYQSPEVFRGSREGKPSDILSLGVTFLAMTTVLRGETLGNVRTFLGNDERKEDNIFENNPGAV